MRDWLGPSTDRGERRGSARGDTLSALRRLLDAARSDGELEAVAIADDTGCLVAGAGSWRTCEELAAFAPLVAANDTVPTRLDVVARTMQVRRLTVDGIEILLCGRGGAEQSASALARAASGCARILGRSPSRL